MSHLKPLPYAPRPIRGEGLASWTARLAVHNFVEPAAFAEWMGAAGKARETPTSEVLRRLAVLSRLPVEDLAPLVASSASSGRAWQVAPNASGLRGGACPVCCREAAEAHQDHWWTGESEDLLRVSCPRHRCRFAGLGQLILTRTPQGLRLMLPSNQPLGAGRTNEPLEASVLEMEAAIAGCHLGHSPGSGWRLQCPATLLRSVEVLIGYVLCAPVGCLPFAQAFDTLESKGRDVFGLTPAMCRRGVASLQGQSIRTRCNALAALQALLAQPSALVGEAAEETGWRTASDDRGPYRALAEYLGREGRAELAGDLEDLPPALAGPAIAAIEDAELDHAILSRRRVRRRRARARCDVRPAGDYRLPAGR
ncbi:TniQ family protein [Phenylobacterium sp. LjRoot225]|uniref:TniQ family protein n=1 Tax=Phenylobacterium sp. LjRoot225 TaxID=3342285 RepID=UPI003ECC7710